jgi:hypothetical protein
MNLINYSKAGAGKSFATVDFVEFLSKLNPEIRFFVKRVDGYFTTKGFMELLAENSYCTIYADESRLLLGNGLLVDLLKSALFNGSMICWKTAKEENNISDLKFEGNIVFNSNKDIQNGTISIDSSSDSALIDRTFVSLLNPTTEEMINIISGSYQQERDVEIWRVIADRVVALRSQPQHIDLTEEETNQILEFWKEKLLLYCGSGHSRESSYRSYERIIQIFGRIKLFFGRLDEELIALAKDLSDCYIVVRTPKSEIKEIVKKYGIIERQQLAKELSELKDISERQAQRHIANAIVKGEIKSINRSAVGIN